MPTRSIETAFRKDRDTYLIEIRLRDLDQFFNTFDPSPFHDKDIDDDVEKYIVSAVRSFPLNVRLKLVFYVPPEHHKEASEVIAYAIDNYFDFRAAIASRDMRSIRYEGALALLTGSLFLALCISLRTALAFLESHAAGSIILEGLSIVGWVAMWRPIQIFLYDWWSLYRMRHVYIKIRDLPVEITLE